MSWIKLSVMQQKERFIRMWKSNDFTFSALCKSFGISRPTGYKLVGDYEKYGEASFASKLTKPRSSPNKTPKFIEDKIIDLRKKNPNWGASKFKVILEEFFKENLIPSEITINAIIKRNHLVKNRRRRSKSVGRVNSKFNPKVCNEIWSADFKGRFRLKNGRYCKPQVIKLNFY